MTDREQAKSELEVERAERMKLWRGKYAEPLDIVPQLIWRVQPGRICRLWFMPNQTTFVVLGVDRDSVRVVLESGHVTGFTKECLVVPIDNGPPDNFPNLMEEIRNFEKHIGLAAWQPGTRQSVKEC